jgi:hypothetical protein
MNAWSNTIGQVLIATGSSRLKANAAALAILPRRNSKRAYLYSRDNMLERSSTVKSGTHRLQRYYLEAQRAAAALEAISLRRFDERRFARALPPFKPPRCPRATAAGLRNLTGFFSVRLRPGIALAGRASRLARFDRARALPFGRDPSLTRVVRLKLHDP